eukprot:CAMPEP_0181338212 /NCGR_PEP_ID=MMETSP1101-20121128/28514_1 /TAXON_ID=46948 /ORGANISM="Rhodomonas abbreviata, Strain Caron Lab Isolate" /LENGTH=176 /DNA_ID=CAMNT_0023448923 /DNA_START=181 /DNA_END=707 /DNA_ORIENTATION=+
MRLVGYAIPSRWPKQWAFKLQARPGELLPCASASASASAGPGPPALPDEGEGVREAMRPVQLLPDSLRPLSRVGGNFVELDLEVGEGRGGRGTRQKVLQDVVLCALDVELQQVDVCYRKLCHHATQLPYLDEDFFFGGIRGRLDREQVTGTARKDHLALALLSPDPCPMHSHLPPP